MHPDDMKIFLDMDGAIVDFVGGACEYYGQPHHKRNWPPGQYDICKVLELSPKYFWDNLPPHFFYNLLPMHDAGRIVEFFDTQYTCILSSPAGDPQIATDKIRWLAKYFPQFVKRFLLGPDKNFVAAPNHVLIDDSDKNVTEFRKAGGKAILVPRMWNSRHSMAGYVFDAVAAEFMEITKQISWENE